MTAFTVGQIADLDATYAAVVARGAASSEGNLLGLTSERPHGPA